MKVAIERIQQEFYKWGHFCGLVLAGILFVLASYFVIHTLRKTSLDDILEYFRILPLGRFGLCLLTTCASYVLLTCYDQLAFKYLKTRLGAGRVAFVSFIAYALGNTIGLANVAGTSVRLRFYTRWGLRANQVFRVIIFCSLSFWLGFLVLAGFTLLLNPPDMPSSLEFSQAFARIIGGIMLAVVLFYLTLTAVRRKPFAIRGLNFQLPSFELSCVQLSVAATDWALAALALFWLLPDISTLGFTTFLSYFVAAQVVALMSHVPGGVGILEAALIHLLDVSTPDIPMVLGALIAYRIIYYFAPLGVGLISLLVFEFAQHKKSKSL